MVSKFGHYLRARSTWVQERRRRRRPHSVTVSNTSQLSSLPVGALWFMFAVTATWTQYQFISVVTKALKSATLFVELTTKCFWRLTESGEVLFPQCVMFSSNGPCQIEDIALSLTRQGEGHGKKLFPLRLENVGVIKQEQSKPMGEFHFHTSSPIHFIGADQEEHPVYRCTVDEFDARIVKVVEELRRNVEEFAADVRKTSGGTPEFSQEDQDKAMERFKSIVRQSTNSIMETVQIDEGEYELSIVVKYRGRKGLGWSQTKTAQSSMAFIFSSDFRGITRTNVERCLATLGRIAIKEEWEEIVYPEYYPKPLRQSSVRRSH